MSNITFTKTSPFLFSAEVKHHTVIFGFMNGENEPAILSSSNRESLDVIIDLFQEKGIMPNDITPDTVENLLNEHGLLLRH